MGRAALIYATKFMVKIREGDLDPTMALMERSILPALGGTGFAEPFVVARRRRMDRLDPEKAEESLSDLARRMVEVSQVREPDLERDLNSLKHGLLHGVHSHAHGMIHHHKKRKRPEAYELLRRKLYAEENRDTVAGVQLDIYTFHSSDASLGADGADLTGAKTNLPFMMRTLTAELEGMLFLEPKAIKYTVFQKTSHGEGRHALQTFVSVPTGKRGEDPRDVKARIRSLVDSLAQRSGAEGAVALKSLADGASKGLGWNPNGIPQHRGDDAGLESEREAREIKGYPDTYELVTFWKSERERDAAKAWLEEALPNAVGRIEAGYGGFASSPGELAFHS